MIRNKSIYKEVYKRDIGLCVCCGFRANTIHHIIPLSYGGNDIIDNMVCMCDVDHYYAPNNKDEFYEYVKHKGVKLDNIMGKVINDYYRNEKLQQDVDIRDVIKVCREFIIILREIDVKYCIEKYNNHIYIKTDDYPTSLLTSCHVAAKNLSIYSILEIYTIFQILHDNDDIFILQ